MKCEQLEVQRAANELAQAEAALRALDGGTATVLVRFNTQIDPATGRHDADTLRLSHVGAGGLRDALSAEVTRRKIALRERLLAAARALVDEADSMERDA